MITSIISDNGWFKAKLEDTDDGVLVTFMGRRRCDGAELWRQISLTTLDVVFHVAADAVFVLLNTMTPEFDSTTPADKRRRVLSLVH
jgi:hypothetical protein